MATAPEAKTESGYKLTEGQEKGAAFVAAGRSAVLWGCGGSGKTVAIEAGLARCHVTTPDVFAHYYVRDEGEDGEESELIFNAKAVAMVPNPFYGFNRRRRAERKALQAAEDASKVGLRKLQLQKAVRDNKVRAGLFETLEPALTSGVDRGSVCVHAFEHGWELLRSPQFAQFAGSVQMVGASLSAPTPDDVALAAKLGVEIVHLPPVTWPPQPRSALYACATAGCLADVSIAHHSGPGALEHHRHCAAGHRECSVPCPSSSPPPRPT
jgi:hypothetical protein